MGLNNLDSFSDACTLNCYLTAPPQLQFGNNEVVVTILQLTESQSVCAGMPRDISPSAALGPDKK